MVPAKKTTEKETPEKAKKPAVKKPAAAHKPAAKKVAAPKPAAAHKPAAKRAPKKEAAVVVEAKPAVVEAPVAVVVEEKKPAAAAPKAEKNYIYALGRRKTAIAQVRMTPGTGLIQVNGKKFNEYFTTFEMRDTVLAPLKAVGQEGKFDFNINVYSGGLSGQSVAVRLGISRALVKQNETYRGTLKKLGFMMRDPREKERKKYGLKKARKGSQWAKR